MLHNIQAIQTTTIDDTSDDLAAESSEEPRHTGPVSGQTPSPKSLEKKRRKPVSTRSFKKRLVEAMPNLRAFAYSLCGRADMAEDLAQEAMAKAWAARDRFKPGTSIKAWVFTILRNTYLSQMRRKKFTGEYNEIAAERILSAPAQQRGPIHLMDLQRAMKELPEKQREALLLVGAGGLSYEEAGDICDCATGTMKSRVSRARKTLEGIFEDGRIKADRSQTSDADKVASDIMGNVQEMMRGDNAEVMAQAA